MALPRKKTTPLDSWLKAENQKIRDRLGEPEWSPLGGKPPIVVEASSRKGYLVDDIWHETLDGAIEAAERLAATTGRPISGPGWF